MTNEEAEKVLKELEEVRPEVLNDEAKRLFEAIMKIADERDLLKEQLDYVVNEYGATIEKQDKIINEMAEFIVHCDIDEDICQYMQDYMQDGGCGDRLECKKCIIEFYSKKVGE